MGAEKVLFCWCYDFARAGYGILISTNTGELNMKSTDIKVGVFALTLAFALFGVQLMSNAEAGGLTGLSGLNEGGAEGLKDRARRERAYSQQRKRELVQSHPPQSNSTAPGYPAVHASPPEYMPSPVVQTEAQPTPQTFMKRPSGIGMMRNVAYQDRERLVRHANDARKVGSGRNMRHYVMQIQKIDGTIRYLMAREAINDMIAGNGWKASQLLSAAYGHNIQIVIHPPNENGQTVVTSSNGNGPSRVVSRNHVIGQLRQEFGIRY